MWRKLFLILLIPGLLLLAGYLFLRFSLQTSIAKEEKKTGEVAPKVDSLGGKKISALDLRPLFLQRVQQLLHRSSKGLYNLRVADLKVDVLNSSLSLQGVKLEPNRDAQDSLRQAGDLPENVFSVSLNDLRIEGINLDDAVTRKTMDYKLLRLVKPDIVIRRKKAPAPKSGKEDFTERFLKEMEALSIRRIEIVDGNITVVNDAQKTAPTQLRHVSVVMNDLRIDSTTRLDKDRFLFAKDAMLSFRDFSKPTKDGLYRLKIGAVTVKAPQQQVRLSGFSFASPLSREAFSKRQTKSKEYYRLTLPSVVVNKVDWWALLNEEEISAEELALQGGRLSVYLDRSLPPRNKLGNFPSQLLMKLPMKLNVEKATVRNLDLDYSEYNPLSQQTGTAYLDNVSLVLSHLSNLPAVQPAPVVAEGSALFMHSVPLSARFTFDRKAYRSGKFSARIKAAGFDGALLNSFTAPMGLMRIERGRLQSAQATLQGDEHGASGDVLVTYQDLRLSLLEKDKGKKDLDKKDVTSFLANLLVLKNDNPKKGQSPRREKGEFVRQPEGGFLMLVWKTMLVGVLRTIGAPEKIAYKKTSPTGK